jgi:hypothetical protein
LVDALLFGDWLVNLMSVINSLCSHVLTISSVQFAELVLAALGTSPTHDPGASPLLELSA